ncbi:hypothetical protein L208DRAFT_502531 [Tricholoma matsutake]|nr:hypothetical protein L208DRAFT_502531 [Tricholoma matsutake 945]
MEHGIVRPLAFEATWEENGEEVWMCVHGQSGLETLLLSIDDHDQRLHRSWWFSGQYLHGSNLPAWQLAFLHTVEVTVSVTCFLLKETHPTSCSDWRYTFCALSEKVVSVLCGVVTWAPTFVVANMMDPARVHFHVDLKISERWDLLDVLLQRQAHYKENFMLLLFAYGDIPCNLFILLFVLLSLMFL